MTLNGRARKTARTNGFRAPTGAADASRTARYPGHVWPANDNKPPVWRGAFGWVLVGMAAGCFAFVAVTLLI